MTVSTYYPKKDGVSKVTQYLAEGLAARGHSVTIVTEVLKGRKDREKYNGVNIIRVNMRTRFGLYFGEKGRYKKLMQDETKKTDVLINVCTQNAFTDVILRKMKQFNCKKILYMHGMFDFRFHAVDFSSFSSIVNKLWKEMRWFFYYALNGRCFSDYDAVVQLHEEDYGNKFFERKYGIKSFIIGNAVDDEFFEEDAVDFKKPFDKYIIYVANYNDRKNQKLAVSKFLESNISPKVGLVLIGSERNRYYYRLGRKVTKMKKKMGLSYGEKPVKLMYNVDRKMIPLYVVNAYLYLMTSKWEAFPIAIIESIACGVPFVTTNVGIVDYLPGGVVVDDRRITYWIEEFFKHETIRDRYSRLALKYARKNLRVEEKVTSLERIILEVCKV